MKKIETFGKLHWIKRPKETLSETLGNITIPWHPQSFFQTNRWIYDQMFSAISQWMSANNVKI